MPIEIKRPRMKATPAGEGNVKSLRDWMRKELINVESTKHSGFKSPYICWQSRRSAIDHWDIHGDAGFEGGDTPEEALDNFCKRAEITIPEEFRGQAVNDN